MAEIDRPDFVDNLVAGMAAVVSGALDAIFGPLARRGRLAREQAQQRVADMDPIEYIRHRAQIERKLGQRYVRDEFDRLYADLGIARQEAGS